MKKYFDRQVVIEGKEVTRNVVEKNGVATVRHQNQSVEVAPVGPRDSKQTKWTKK